MSTLTLRFQRFGLAVSRVCISKKSISLKNAGYAARARETVNEQLIMYTNSRITYITYI